MKYLKMLLLLLLVVFMFGCASFHYPTAKSSESFTIPDLGIETTAYLGEPIITSGSGYYADGLYVNNSVSGSSGLFISLEINKGFYELTYTSSMYKYYHPIDKEMIKWYGTKGHDPSMGLQLRVGVNSFDVINTAGGYTSAKSFKNGLQIEEKTNYFIAKKNSLQQTVIYTGKQDNILKFSYREFSNDMARPAFTTDIT